VATFGYATEDVMTRGLVLACAVGAAIAAGAACNNMATTSESCEGPTTGSFTVNPICTACMKKNCSGQLAADQSQCADYNKCYCGCASGDSNCQGGCISMLNMACTQADQDLTNCGTMNCLDTCNSVEGGTGSSSSGGGGGG